MDDQTQQPTDAQSVDQAGAAASDSPQEAESSFFNSMIRGLAGVFGGGRDQDASARDAEPRDADAETTTDAASQQSPVDITQTPEFQRAVQAAKDRELVRYHRESAAKEAEQGNLQPMRDLAERDPWAERQLARNGDTWAVGEKRTKELLEQEARENDPVPILASGFDQAILWPVLGALPEEEERRIVGQGIQGFDGRQKAMTEAVASLKRVAAEEALAKALEDPAYVERALKSDAFRSGILSHPVLGKQLLARHRGEWDEPDLAPGSGPGRGGDRESDVMNQMIRGLAQGAEMRGPAERAAGAGARSRRAVNLDVLDDDE